MESRERIACALTHRQVDRTPKFDYVLLNPCAERVLGRSFISYEDSPGDWEILVKEKGEHAALLNYVRERLEISEKLGHDLLYVTQPPRLASAQEEEEDVPFYDDPVDRLAARNEQERKDLEQPFDDARLEIYDLLYKEMDRPFEIFAPAYTLGVWSDIDLMQTMVLEPDIAAEHFCIAAEQAIRQIKAYVEHGIRLIGIGGDFAGNRPIISPELYRELIVPQIRRVSQAAHSMDVWTVNASDGNLWSVIEDFLLGCEVDAYMEIDSRAGMDLGKLKSAYGDKICFMGNLDCGELMSFGTPKAIREEVFQCLEDGGKTGHIFTPSNAITNTVPYENFQAMHDAYNEYFGLSRICWE